MAVKTLSTVKLSVNGESGTPKSVECQSTRIALVPTAGNTSTITTMCGVEEVAGPTSWALEINGYQDWGTGVDALCEILWDAWLAGQDDDPDTSDLIDYEETVGTTVWTGQARPLVPPIVGGDAGAPLPFDLSLSCVGTPERSTVTP